MYNKRKRNVTHKRVISETEAGKACRLPGGQMVATGVEAAVLMNEVALTAATRHF